MMAADINKRGGGLMQLVAYGAPDVYLIVNATTNAVPFNTRDSMASRWFVAREHGLATRDDIDGSAVPILAHAPASMAPAKGSHRPFSVREERIADPPKTTFVDYATAGPPPLGQCNSEMSRMTGSQMLPAEL